MACWTDVTAEEKLAQEQAQVRERKQYLEVHVQEIAAASSEQTSGLSQIGTAMGTLNETTQQNALATEQLATTSVELRTKAEQLQQAMAFFQLAQEQPRFHPAVKAAAHSYQ